MERRVEERAVKYFIRDWSLLFTAWGGAGGVVREFWLSHRVLQYSDDPLSFEVNFLKSPPFILLLCDDDPHCSPLKTMESPQNPQTSHYKAINSGWLGGWLENFGCVMVFCSILMIPCHLKSIFQSPLPLYPPHSLIAINDPPCSYLKNHRIPLKSTDPSP